MQGPGHMIGFGELLAAVRPATHRRRLLLLGPTRGSCAFHHLRNPLPYRFSNPVCALVQCCAVLLQSAGYVFVAVLASACSRRKSSVG